MATALQSIPKGGRTYYLSHSGETVYYSTEGPGRGTTKVNGLVFKKNEILKKSTGKVATEYEIANEIGK